MVTRLKKRFEHLPLDLDLRLVLSILGKRNSTQKKEDDHLVTLFFHHYE